jgi:hypothetical protein
MWLPHPAPLPCTPLPQVFAQATWMILLGRCILGFGNGFNEHVRAFRGRTANRRYRRNKPTAAPPPPPPPPHPTLPPPAPTYPPPARSAPSTWPSSPPPSCAASLWAPASSLAASGCLWRSWWARAGRAGGGGLMQGGQRGQTLPPCLHLPPARRADSQPSLHPSPPPPTPRHQVNWSVRNLENGWQWSLGVICIPSGVLLLGSLLMTDSPNSLVTRGKRDAAAAALRRLRGVDDVAAELADLERAAKAAGALTTRASWRLIATNRQYWPPLIIAFMGVSFNWWSGNAAATFYSPQIFKLLGSGTDTALINSVAMGVTKACGVIIGARAGPGVLSGRGAAGRRGRARRLAGPPSPVPMPPDERDCAAPSLCSPHHARPPPPPPSPPPPKACACWTASSAARCCSGPPRCRRRRRSSRRCCLRCSCGTSPARSCPTRVGAGGLRLCWGPLASGRCPQGALSVGLDNPGGIPRSSCDGPAAVCLPPCLTPPSRRGHPVHDPAVRAGLHGGAEHYCHRHHG